MKLFSVVAVLVVCCLVPAAEVDASCAAPAIELLWSYPENGARDVPINSEFWLLTNGWTAPSRATLDGRVIEVRAVGSGGIHITPGDLEPNRVYSLALEYAKPGSREPVRIEVAFNTGATEAAPASAPQVRVIDTRMGLVRDETCVAEIVAQGCFDTGQNTLVSFDAVAAGAEGWLVENAGDKVLWPQRCDRPTLFTHPPAKGACYDVRVIGAGGLLSEPTRRCDTATTPTAGAGSAQRPDAGASVADASVDRGDEAEERPDASSSTADEASVDRDDEAEEGSGCRVARRADMHDAWLWLVALGIACRVRRRAVN